MAETEYILAGRLIDGSGSPVRRNILLEMKDGVIIALRSAAEVPDKPAIVDVDLSHCTLVPALVDCSVALLQSPSVGGNKGEETAEQENIQRDMLERHIRYCFTHGVLGLLAQDKNSLLQEYQRVDEDNDQKKQKKQVRGLDIRTAHDGADADVLRLMYSPSIDENTEERAGGSLQLNSAALCHLLQNRDRKKAIVVANGSQQVAEALEAGCDAIEQGYAIGEANLRVMADKGVLWIPNLVRAKNALDGASGGGSVCCRFSTRYVAPGDPIPGAEAHWKKVLEEQLAQLRLARELGVKVAVGTGAGSVGILHGESVVEEIKLFIKAGYSLEESIQCASKNGAEFFGMQELGQLAVGQRATFLFTRGTAGQLPRKLAYLEGIFMNGQPSPEYKK
ncbi:MAG: amidohydrolase family protein [Candidatus Electrothrix aestuarii]|uniref:Amidohydrolase family protein n=1 Tax=Candidatus Electrothrix aestuarii TaxID=3062594 RepID=A0AAU8LPY9_9BACT|nr:amidohydrolase family protein [Candidatus Electrothrix aestuarii]